MPEDSAGHRHARLEELILEELRGLFRDDVSDPALAGVRVTSLVLSVDYRHARVHFVLDEAPDTRRVHERLLRVTPFLRARLGDSLDLKRTPELTFVLDAVTGISTEAGDPAAPHSLDFARFGTGHDSVPLFSSYCW